MRGTRELCTHETLNSQSCRRSSCDSRISRQLYFRFEEARLIISRCIPYPHERTGSETLEGSEKSDPYPIGFQWMELFPFPLCSIVADRPIRYCRLHRKAIYEWLLYWRAQKGRSWERKEKGNCGEAEKWIGKPSRSRADFALRAIAKLRQLPSWSALCTKCHVLLSACIPRPEHNSETQGKSLKLGPRSPSNFTAIFCSYNRGCVGPGFYCYFIYGLRNI